MSQRGRPSGSERTEDPLAEELREKTLALVSVQRNYESISRLMQLKQQELEQSETALAAEQASVLSLGIQLEDCRARCTSLERHLEGLKGLPGQLASMEAAHEALKREAAQASTRALALQEAMRGLRQSLEEEQRNSERQRHQLESWRKTDSGLGAEVASLRQQLVESQGDCRAMGSELRALRDALGRSGEAAKTEAQRAAGLAAQVASQEDTVRSLQDEIRTLTQLNQELRSSQRASEVALAAARGGQAVLEGQLRGAQRAAEVGRQLQDDLAGQLAAAEAALADTKVALEDKEEDLDQMRNLLDDLQERYQASLSGKLAADEVSSSLQVQLAQTRGALTEARRHAAALEQEAMRANAAAAEAERASAARATSAARLLSAVQYRLGEVGANAAARLDGVVERLLGRLAERIGSGLADEVERVDRVMTVTSLKLQTWEGQLLDMEAHLVGLGKGLEVLTAAAVRQQAARDREVNTVRSDAAALRSRVDELRYALEAETAARQLLATSKAAMEIEHRTALLAAQSAADDRVETERQRLGARLAAVEEEVAGLTRTHQREMAAAARSWESERQQLTRRLEEVGAELVKAREVKAQPLQLGGPVLGTAPDHSAALAVLHTQMNADLVAEREAHETQLAAYREQLETCRSHIRATWSVSTKLATDLALVARHLSRCGVALPPGAGELPPGLHGVAEDGGGAQLAALAGAVRAAFGGVAEGVQGAVRRLQHLGAKTAELEAKAATCDPNAWSAVAAELRSTVAKLVHVEDSLAPPCTCLMCLEVFKSPVTLVPCGHTFCRACLSGANGLCSECGADAPAAVTVANSPLDAVCAKYELKRSALAAIQRALQTAGEGGAGGGGSVGRMGGVGRVTLGRAGGGGVAAVRAMSNSALLGGKGGGVGGGGQGVGESFVGGEGAGGYGSGGYGSGGGGAPMTHQRG